MAVNLYDDALEMLDEQTPARPQSVADEADAVLEDQDRAQRARLRAAFRLATDTTPDQAATARRLSLRYGVPPRAIARNLEAWTERESLDHPYGQIQAETPALAGWLEDPANAALVKDDLRPLSTMERTLGIGRNLVGSALAGVMGFSQGVWGAIQAGAESVGAAPLPPFPGGPAPMVFAPLAPFAGGAAAVAGALAERARGRQPGAGFVERSIYSGVESVGQMLPALVTGAMAGPGALLGVVGATSGGQAYAQAREQGVTPGPAGIYAGLYGVVEVATEYIPMHWLLGDLAAKAPLVKMLVHQIVSEVPGENVATVLQDLDEWAFLPANKDRTFADYLQQRPSALAATTIATIVAVGLQTTVAHGTARVLEQLGDAARDSKTVARAPEAVGALVERMTADGPLATVYLPVEPFASYFQAKGIDPGAMAARLTDDPAAFGQAQQTGQDLAVPMSRYLTEIAPTEHNAFFSQEARFAPEAPNVRETTALGRQLETEAQATELAAPTAPTAADRIRQIMTERLVEAGTPVTTAENYADLWAAAVGTMAERAGVDPLTLFREYDVQLRREGIPEETAAPEAAAAQPPTPPGEVAAAPTAAAPAAGAAPPTPDLVDQVGRAALELTGARPVLPPEFVPVGGELALAPPTSAATLTGDQQAFLATRLRQAEEVAAARGEVLTEAQHAEILAGALEPTKPGAEAAMAEAARGRVRPAEPRPAGAVDTGIRGEETVPDVLTRAAQEGEAARAERVSAFRGVEASYPPARRESARQFGARREAHYNQVFASLLEPARQVDPTVDPDQLRAELDSRAQALEALDAEWRDSGHNPRRLLEQIAASGGISLEAEEGGYAGELRVLRESSAFGPFGSFAGVRGVFRQLERRQGTGTVRFDKSLDDMLGQLQQDPEFQYLEDVNDLLLALEDAARLSEAGPAGAVLPGTTELGRLGVDPGQAWWLSAAEREAWDQGAERRAITELGQAPVGERWQFGPKTVPKVSDAWLAAQTDEALAKYRQVGAGKAVTLSRGGQSPNRLALEWDALVERIDNELARRKTTKAATVDVLKTGEVQALLPGEVGAVRQQEVPTPAFEAPFALTPEAARGARMGEGEDYQLDLFGEPLPAPGRPEAGALVDVRPDALRGGAAGEAQFATRTQLVTQSTRQLGASSILTPEDAATAATYLAPGAQERFDAIVTDAQGTPLGIVGSFKGGVDSSNVYPGILLAEAFRIEGAAAIWFVHNHPSGSAELSDADAQIAARFADLLRGTDIQLKGFLAIGAGEEGLRRFASFDPATGLRDAGTVRARGQGPRVPVLEREFVTTGKLGQPIARPEEATAAVPALARGEFGAVLADTKLQPIGFLPIDPSAAAQLRTGGRLDALYRAISVGNPTGVLINAPAGTEQAALNLANAFHAAGVRVLDIVEARAEGTVSHRREAGGFGFEARFTGRFEQPRRGSIVFGPGRKVAINLFERADLSTFLHESGHLFLEVFGDLADRVRGLDPATLTAEQRQLVADYDALLRWAGAEQRTALTREQHEQFAAAFEGYLMEGQAPSLSLRGIFARFRAWLVGLYHSLQKVGVDLTPEVRAVFDRLLATDVAIEAAAADASARPLFTDETARAAGLSPEDVAAYRATVEAASARARDRVQAQLLAQLQRERKTWWRKEQQVLRPEVAAEIGAQPVYKALAVLQRGTLPDGSPLPAGLEGMKLSKQGLVAEFGHQVLAALPRPLVYAARGGMPASVAADLLGFPSSRALVDALRTALPFDQAVDAATDARLRERHGDLLLDGQLGQVAQTAVLDAGAEVYAAELQFLERLVAGQGVRVPPTSVRTVREQAERRIATLTVREVRPPVFAAAARRAGQVALEAAGRQDLGAALDAKRRQVLNAELYRAATAAVELVDEAQAAFRKVFARDASLAPRYNLDLVNAARALLGDVGLATREERGRASAYLDQVAAYDPQTYEDLQAARDQASQGARSWRDLTVDEFVALRDGVLNLWHLARRSQQIRVEGKLEELADVRGELEGRLAAITPRGRQTYKRKLTRWQETKRYLLGWRAALRRVEHWVEAVDGGDPQGAFRRLLFTPIAEATSAYRVAKKQVLERYLAIVKGVETSLTAHDIPAPELDYTFSGKAELLHALLHTGNESNLRKLLLGDHETRPRWGEVADDDTLDTSRWDRFVERLWREGVLTKTDYDFVQGVWDLLDTLKPEAQRVHHDLYGYYFSEITAREVRTPFGPYRGGYVPAIYDPFLSDDAARRADQAAVELTPSSFMFPTTGRGFTIRRIDPYVRPLMLDLRVLPLHLDKVLRFIHLQPPVKDAGRLVIHKSFRSALGQLDPTVAGELLVPWLQRAARQTVDTPAQGWGGRGADRFFRALRRRTGMQIMVGNVVNTLQQFTGLGISALKVPPPVLGRALWRYVRGPRILADAIAEKSAFMRTRTMAQAIEIQATIDDLLLNPSKYEQARAFATKHGYFLQQGTQNIVDLVTWSATYDHQVADGATDPEAVQRADAVVRMTQGTFNPEDLSAFETGTPLHRVFTMFMSYFNMWANMLGTEFTIAVRDLGLKAGAGRLLYIYTFGFLPAAVLSELIVKAGSGQPWDEDDDGQILDDVLVLFFGAQLRAATAMVPIVGPMLNAGINMFNDKWYDDRMSVSPAVQTIESAVGAPHAVYKAIFEDGRKKTAIRDTLTTIGLLTGLPVAPLGRPLGYAADVAEGRVEPKSAADLARGLIVGR